MIILKYTHSELTGRKYKTHTWFGWFLMHKILYPICNPIGLNRLLSLTIHELGLYPEFVDGRCMWCGWRN